MMMIVVVIALSLSMMMMMMKIIMRVMTRLSSVIDYIGRCWIDSNSMTMTSSQQQWMMMMMMMMLQPELVDGTTLSFFDVIPSCDSFLGNGRLLSRSRR
jgi:hypothetical protein